MNKEAVALMVVSAKYTANLQCTKRALQSIWQQEELYLNNQIEDLEDFYYTPKGYFMDNLAI